MNDETDMAERAIAAASGVFDRAEQTIDARIDAAFEEFRRDMEERERRRGRAMLFWLGVTNQLEK